MKAIKKITAAVIACVLVCALGITSFAYDLPQPYSSETIGDPVEVVVPEEPVQDGIVVYLNNTEMSLESKPFKDGDILYIPAEIFTKLGLNLGLKGDIVKIDNGAASGVSTVLDAEFDFVNGKGNVNGTEVAIAGEIKKVDEKVYLPIDVLALSINEKVWFDAFSDTLVITTGKYKSDDILRNINCKFWMNGEPYYEISFNKFDLAYQISSYFARDNTWPTKETQIEAAEAALAQLQELGFKTIRVFMYSIVRGAYARSQKQREKFFTVMDQVFDSCDKYGIQVVVCLGIPSSDFSPKGEDLFDLVCNPESESRKICNEFVDTFVTKYKDRHSVLMWEMVNEGSLDCDVGMDVRAARFSLYQLGQFYADMAERIRAIDKNHLITGGDSCLRGSQWHLYLGVKEGRTHSDWTRDTLEDRLKAYTMLYHGIDVVSMHTYSTGLGDSAFRVSDTDETMVKEDFKLYMSEMKRMGKILYNGETAVDADNYSEEVYQKSLDYIQSIIEAGVQLSHWWTFRSDRSANFHDGYGWRIDSGELLDAIVAGNKQIKETYVVNSVTVDTSSVFADNSEAVIVSGNIETTEGTVYNLKEKSGCGSAIGSAFIMISVACAAAVVLKKRK